jgi:DNA-binding transcriptional regulator LsrR (DeoR family)
VSRLILDAGQAVLAVVQDGWRVVEVARRLGVSRQSVHTWIARYEQGGLAALADRSHEFAYTPIGTVQPNGQHVQWELINIFGISTTVAWSRSGVQTDTYDLLRQLGAVGS